MVKNNSEFSGDMLIIEPITLKEARAFVDENHRHCKSKHAWKFGVGLSNNGELVGVGIAGRPVARALDDGKTIEVNRVCILEGNKNGNSKIYSAICRASEALGYKRAVTYTLEHESGASLKASGFKIDGYTIGDRDWNSASKKLKNIRPPSDGRYPTERKIRWVRVFKT